ncbi:MAG: N-acetyl-gamma-glutamyl-phosphate reductase [Anaerovoracaceae bacterium]
MEGKVGVGIIGATGYGGVELVRLLNEHPKVEITAISSVSFGGQEISDIYPGLRSKFQKDLLKEPKEVIECCQVVFAALPHGLSEDIAAECALKGVIFIDLGADFRLDSQDEYISWYGKPFDYPELHEDSVYGLCEVFRDEIKGSRLIANPGCYPTSVAIALYPALKHGYIEPKGIVIDSKSGVTGAGRGLSQTTHFPQCNEAFSAYKAGAHRHLPEIEQVLGRFSRGRIAVTFVPHLLPVNRGILSTIYCDKTVDIEIIRKGYEETYGNEPFVMVLKEGEYSNIANVRFSNCCHISLHVDNHTGKLIICSAIDNMVKGASGQAIQNMNIALGYPETMGLPFIAPAF